MARMRGCGSTSRRSDQRPNPITFPIGPAPIVSNAGTVSYRLSTCPSRVVTGCWNDVIMLDVAMQIALRNHYFDEAGLPDFTLMLLLNRVEPPWYVTPMPGGVGGAGP